MRTSRNRNSAYAGNLFKYQSSLCWYSNHKQTPTDSYTAPDNWLAVKTNRSKTDNQSTERSCDQRSSKISMCSNKFLLSRHLISLTLWCCDHPPTKFHQEFIEVPAPKRLEIFDIKSQGCEPLEEAEKDWFSTSKCTMKHIWIHHLCV